MLSQHPAREQIRMEAVLSALGHPVRLAILRILDEEGELPCGTVGVQLPVELSKSALTHHWRVLRDSGVIWQRPAGRENLLSIRRDDLAVRCPGLVDAILNGAPISADSR